MQKRELERVGAKYVSDIPRRWYKLEGGIERGEVARKKAEEEGLRDALEIAFPDSNPELYKLHLYDSDGEIQDLPTEVVVVTENSESFSMECFSVLENDRTTEKTDKTYDDRLGDLEVLHQIAQGQDHGYGHRSSFNSDNRETISDLGGEMENIFKGKDDLNWSLEVDTHPWSSKKELNPLDYYHIAPRFPRREGNESLDDYSLGQHGEIVENHDELLEEDSILVDSRHGKFTTRYREMVDEIVDNYGDESDGLLDLRESRFGRMAEKSDYSEREIQRMVDQFPEKMDQLYDDWVSGRI